MIALARNNSTGQKYDFTQSVTKSTRQFGHAMEISRTNVASVGSVFNDMQKVKVLSLPETIKEKLTFRAKALRRELVVGGGGRRKPRVNQMDFIKTKCKQRNVM